MKITINGYIALATALGLCMTMTPSVFAMGDEIEPAFKKIRTCSDYDLQQALKRAIDSGDLSEVKMVLARGVDLNLCFDDGDRPLHIAVENGEYEVAQELLNRGAKIDLRSHDGFTALHIAVMKKDIDIVRLLLDNGADVNALADYPDGDGEQATALHLAAANGVPTIVELLLDRGANVNSLDSFNRLALHFAADNVDYRTAEILIEHNSKLNVQNEAMYTPINLVVSSESTQRYTIQFLNLIKLLISSGADSSIPDDSGYDVLKNAVELRENDVIGYLIKSSLNPSQTREDAYRYALELSRDIADEIRLMPLN